ncbi:hypothetical protein [Azospirillum sp. BE72]|uniref:hypothetical protein n=1 Tax=Azospirillum sp. BE72 TaxID=2817776 RepID=UPI002860F7A2|nr:hypothetical protein [Azospirillum sp. BE72]MDR6772673.1 hypothetical protein [Azospirillum sp. BE72]
MTEKKSEIGAVSHREDSAGPTTSAQCLQPTDKGLDHAWRYFALHAQQRISVFNFFVVLSGIISAGIGAGLQGGKPMAPVVAMLGGLLMLFSFLFFKLDQRGSELVKIAENALASGETACMPNFARVILDEAQRGRAGSQGNDTKLVTWTFGRSFRLIFRIMGAVGAVASVISIYRWIS